MKSPWSKEEPIVGRRGLHLWIPSEQCTFGMHVYSNLYKNPEEETLQKMRSPRHLMIYPRSQTWYSWIWTQVSATSALLFSPHSGTIRGLQPGGLAASCSVTHWPYLRHKWMQWAPLEGVSRRLMCGAIWRRSGQGGHGGWDQEFQQ